MNAVSAALNVIGQYQADHDGKLPVELAVDAATYHALDREAWAVIGLDGPQGPLDHVAQICGVWLHVHPDAATDTLWANDGCYRRRPPKPDSPIFTTEGGRA